MRKFYRNNVCSKICDQQLTKLCSKQKQKAKNKLKKKRLQNAWSLKRKTSHSFDILNQDKLSKRMYLMSSQRFFSTNIQSSHKYFILFVQFLSKFKIKTK
jgi:hypothetical protein